MGVLEAGSQFGGSQVVAVLLGLEGRRYWLGLMKLPPFYPGLVHGTEPGTTPSRRRRTIPWRQG